MWFNDRSAKKLQSRDLDSRQTWFHQSLHVWSLVNNLRNANGHSGPLTQEVVMHISVDRVCQESAGGVVHRLNSAHCLFCKYSCITM